MNNAFERDKPINADAPKQRRPGQSESEQRSQADPGRPYAGREDQAQGGRSDYEANYQQNQKGSSGGGEVFDPAKQRPGAEIGSDDPTQHRNQQDTRTNIGIDDEDGSLKAVSRKQTPQRP
ncbi:MAG TPA: hypothetical protein VFS42_09290 [Burkholderiaceae bacterium]|nr:hypothetical protein [Burkholderiaceae bacterium]